MKTECRSAESILSSRDLDETVAFLKKGCLVAIPTETVYGLAADVFQEEAVREIFRVKGRPVDNPLIAHICDLMQLDRLVLHPHKIFLRLAERFWPGPLTLIAARHPEVPGVVSAGLSTIAVRMPSHPCAQQIIRALDSPLAAPSANRSGRPSPTTADDVLEDFVGCIPLIIDGGRCSFGIESTVIGFIDDFPVLLRPGAIQREEIESFLQMRLEDPRHDGPVLSPGMKYRHYAPKAKIRLIEVDEPLHSAYCPHDLSAYNLYHHLRQADRLGYSEIVIRLDAKIRSDEALMNRLKRAVG